MDKIEITLNDAEQKANHNIDNALADTIEIEKINLSLELWVDVGE